MLIDELLFEGWWQGMPKKDDLAANGDETGIQAAEDQSAKVN